MPGGDGRGPMGGGRGRMNSNFVAGPGPQGDCVCPSCGHKSPHSRGQPCNEIKCPKCGSIMTRN
ncbi:MAG: hypothetical protein KAS32_08185 [Candidatus Peribacteraceae bacterium]|nr:hypothetical protein [Candidatus Peribacteraceae bacterium]